MKLIPHDQFTGTPQEYKIALLRSNGCYFPYNNNRVYLHAIRTLMDKTICMRFNDHACLLLKLATICLLESRMSTCMLMHYVAGQLLVSVVSIHP